MANDQAQTEPGFKTTRKTPPEGVLASGWRVMILSEQDGMWVGFPPTDLEGDSQMDDPWFN